MRSELQRLIDAKLDGFEERLAEYNLSRKAVATKRRFDKLRREKYFQNLEELPAKLQGLGIPEVHRDKVFGCTKVFTGGPGRTLIYGPNGQYIGYER